jgi:hypothetical protein
VVLDEDTDELLVRTRMRNDTFIGGSWQKQKGALSGARNAVSPRLRVALSEEITRLLPLVSKPEVAEYADQVIAELDIDIDVEIEVDIDTDPQTLRPSRPSRPADPQTRQTRRLGRPADSADIPGCLVEEGVWGRGIQRG